mmetsp:Transcript_16410/g.41845  ORF Transcript_16410/g.41845 Transcript_16410/m.41845 type:complete len:222 (-) Transcript_16410:422-1087(-)
MRRTRGGRASSSSGCSRLRAALTTLQLSWPRIIKSLTPRWETANSIEPPTVERAHSPPALRAIKMSPGPWSNMSSEGTRESAQPSKHAFGSCPLVSNCLCASESCICWPAPARNRLFPSSSSSSSCCGVETRTCASRSRISSLGLSGRVWQTGEKGRRWPSVVPRYLDMKSCTSSALISSAVSLVSEWRAGKGRARKEGCVDEVRAEEERAGGSSVPPSFG